jgi:hypothetical protein
MQQLKQLLKVNQHDPGAGNARFTVWTHDIAKAVNEFDQSEGMRESFRKAASDLAIEAGVIAAPVKHDEVAGSVLQDVYFLQLLAGSQLTMQRLSIRYEKLRAAAIHVSDDFVNGDDSDGWDALRELLDHD